jgi:hypothetical protein
MTISSKLVAVAVVAAAAAPWLTVPATAAPMSSSLGLRTAVAPSIETVQYRHGWRGGYYGHGGPIGVGLGLAGAGIGLAGAIVGGAIVGATRPYGYGYDGYGPGYYGYAPGYAPGYVAVSPYADGSEVGYCQQRFRSYDPASGTYLGFDGLRHPCP